MTQSSPAPLARIRETVVPARFPDQGPVGAVLCGEAPGPRGADKSAWQFWGDQAGLLLYKGLHRAGVFTKVRTKHRLAGLFDEPVDGLIDAVGPDFDACPYLRPWNGTRFAQEGIEPVLEGIVTTNAYAVCPSKDGQKFHRPTNAQLRDPGNVERLEQEIAAAMARSEGATLQVIALGTAAAEMYRDRLRLQDRAGVRLHCLPHPAPQGILAWKRVWKLQGEDLSVPECRIRWIKLLTLALRGEDTLELAQAKGWGVE